MLCNIIFLLLDLIFLASIASDFLAAQVTDRDIAITALTRATVQLAEVQRSIFSIILSWLYFTIFESSSLQATPGKMALGIIVTDLSGNRISFARANGRYWGKILSGLTLGIGYIMAGFTRKKQALHDIMAGTLVVKK
jgi:uncharacterized RDD family membrane protein YckC